jgi:subtilisin family serine protease
LRTRLTFFVCLTLLLLPTSVQSKSENFIKSPEIIQNQAVDEWSDQIHWNLVNVNALEAWELSTGSPDIIVAIVDTGVDYNHPDLISSIWTNEDEIPNNGIDDDTNGFVDDTIGWDFVDNDNDPYDEIGYNAGHGTHVAGTIAARFNNYGLVGIAPDVSIMPIRMLGQDENDSHAGSLSAAIQYAVDNGAKVISMSLNASPDAAFYNALEDAKKNNVILVAAAGNDNSNIIGYPAGEDSVIAVAAVGENNERALFSNYGPVIDISAPGLFVNSTTNSDYATSVFLKINGSDMRAFGVRNSKTTGTTPIEGDVVYVEDFAKNSADLSGKVTLITRQVNDTINQDLVANFSSQGAIGVIFADFTTSYTRPIVLNSKSQIPVISVSADLADVFVDEILRNNTLRASLVVKQTNYQLWSGTSMATPHVSAAAALMYSLNDSLSDEEVKQILERSATDLGEIGWDQFYGNGLLDIQAALLTTIDTMDPQLELKGIAYDKLTKLATLNIEATDDTFIHGYGYLVYIDGESTYAGSIVNPEKSKLFVNELQFILSDLETRNVLYITVEDFRGRRKNYQFDLVSLILGSAQSTSTITTTDFPFIMMINVSLLIVMVKKYHS